MNEYLECAKVASAHGFRGGMKLLNLCDTPESLASLGTVYLKVGQTYEPHKVLQASVFKNMVIATLSDITTEEQVLALKGASLYASREDFELDDHQFFLEDVIGMHARDERTGKDYGPIARIENRGAQDLLVVLVHNIERMIPAVPEFLSRIEDDTVWITPIPGLMDDESET